MCAASFTRYVDSYLDENSKIFLLTKLFTEKEAAKRNGVRAKIRGDEIFRAGQPIQPRFLLKMENYPKVFCKPP